MYFFQTPATGVASWPSRVATLLGEGVTEEEWKLLRRGDRRASEYVQWAVKNGQEGYRVLSRLCRESGPELHASLRMNLFWQEDKLKSDPLVPTIGKLERAPHPRIRCSTVDFGTSIPSCGSPEVRNWTMRSPGCGSSFPTF